MRILAPRKRDSITGEEAVLLSVSTNAVGAATRQSNSTVSRSNNINNNNVGQRASSASLPVDVLPEKLLNIVDREGRPVYGSSSSYSANVVKYGKQKPVTSGHKKKEKSFEGNWTSRIGNKVTNFWIVLNAYCCAAQDDRRQQQEACGLQTTTSTEAGSRRENEIKVFSEKAIINCGDAIIAKLVEGQEEEGISKESQQGAKSFSEKKVVANNNFSGTTNTPCIVITGSSAIVAITTHVETTTKTASDINPVAATGTANFKTMRAGIYHEKQIKSLCALHALNNLLQDGKAFKQEDLDKICSELDPNSWVNPHKSVFGLGNYDINVIMTALQQKKLEAVWFDKRKDPSEELNFENIYGFILNIPSDCRLGWLALPIKRKHWVAIRNLPSITERDAGRSNYYNLDSKFDKPESIGSTDNLIEYLRGELKSPEKELFLVVTEDIGRLETWRKNPPPPPTSSIGASTAASGSSTHLLPVPTTSGENGPDAAAGGGNNRRTSNDSGVVDLLPDLRDINVVDLNKEDLMRRQSSGVWSDLT